MKKTWIIKKHDHAAAKELADELSVTPLLAALLIARGYADPQTAKDFLQPRISQMHPPIRLKDIQKAAKRIIHAADRKEKILIWGDYDVDGTTGTALLRRLLKELGAVSEFHIPNRFSEGYGINIPRLEQFKNDGGTLVITVDCGIRSFEAAEWLRPNGIDLIITDHHIADPVNGNPDAYAVVNPNQADCQYPDKDLAGVGVALKLALQLFEETGQSAPQLVDSFYEIAAIGTIADVMNLGGENRVIVSHGIDNLRATANHGLRAMMEAADCRSDMTSQEIAFRIAPRINAAGRMDAAGTIVDLLESDDFSKARKIAQDLNELNYQRQQMQQKITDFSIAESTAHSNKDILVVSGENWHRGVIGLAASRLVERFHRPAIVFSVENGLAHGSARSIPGFDILAALETCSEYLEQFGGHTAAAGMKMKAENIPVLRKMLEQHAEAVITEEIKQSTLEIDARLASSSITADIVKQLKGLEPYGHGNRKPVFVTDGLHLRFDPQILKDKHIKYYLGDTHGNRFEALWWNGVEQIQGQTPRQGESIEVAYRLDLNTWQGNTKVQLVVEDIRPDNSKA